MKKGTTAVKATLRLPVSFLVTRESSEEIASSLPSLALKETSKLLRKPGVALSALSQFRMETPP